MSPFAEFCIFLKLGRINHDYFGLIAEKALTISEYKL